MRLLRETAKELDLIDSALCTYIWKVCNERQFKDMRCTDFIMLMNLREPLPEVHVHNRETGRICYMISEMSKRLFKKSYAEEWIDTILQQFGISRGTYDHHHYINTDTASKVNKDFASDINQAIEYASS